MPRSEDAAADRFHVLMPATAVVLCNCLVHLLDDGAWCSMSCDSSDDMFDGIAAVSSVLKHC